MQSRNPVLSRIGQEAPGGSGFAYQEGMSAYNQAASGPATATAAPQYGTPQYGAAPTYPPQLAARLTMSDVITKTAISFAVLLVGAAVGWQITPSAPFVVWGAMLVGLVLGLVNVFKKSVSPALVLAYALVQGVFLGGISFVYDNWVQSVNPEYTGLIGQAVAGTLVAFAVMLFVYKTRIVKVNGTFMKIMTLAMISYAVIAMMSLFASFFGVGGGFGFYGLGGLGIALMLFAVALAAFSLLMDFAAIEHGVAMGLPERESWRMAFGLMVTLIWLYLEILRLLAILAMSRD
jgi:uncharacterized YccA/Bax inhibitor family protein